jgi:hypothetical protein
VETSILSGFRKLHFVAEIFKNAKISITPGLRIDAVRRTARSGFDFRNRLLPVARTRMSALARYLLALDD